MASVPTHLHLELYFERPDDLPYAEAIAGRLRNRAAALAPHLHLTVRVLQAHTVVRSHFEYGGHPHDVPHHRPTLPFIQSVLMTHEDIGAAGWGGPDTAVVSQDRMREKDAAGGDAIDILLHEWIHTLEGTTINGHQVPNADRAELEGFSAGFRRRWRAHVGFMVSTCARWLTCVRPAAACGAARREWFRVKLLTLSSPYPQNRLTDPVKLTR